MGESGDEHGSPFDRPADLLFFTTLGCHLCEQAEQMLGSVAHSQRIELAVDVIDIADDAALVETYGIRIPVFKRVCDGVELGWPFGEEQLVHFLAGAVDVYKAGETT